MHFYKIYITNIYLLFFIFSWTFLNILLNSFLIFNLTFLRNVTLSIVKCTTSFKLVNFVRNYLQYS